MTNRQINLEGQVAIITGGGGGIGAGIARIFHSCGAKVALADINQEAAEKVAAEIGEDAIVTIGDIADESATLRMVDEVMAHWGRVDILVNNATAIPVTSKGLLGHDTDKWTKAILVNQLGAVNMCRAVGKQLVEQQSGSVINISSTGGIRPGGGASDYSMSKAALDMLTKTLAAQWGHANVRINSIAPGSIDAGAVEYVVKEMGITREQLAAASPLGKQGQPEDIGWLAAFLASDLANFITGVVIPVDGGMLTR